MKTNGAKQIHYDSGPNMTPLVDVVMVILIFLMLAGSFAGNSRFLISKSNIRGPGPGTESIDVPTEINVSHQTGGGFVATGPGITPTSDPVQVTAFLSNKNKVFLSANPQDVPNARKFQVVLKPDKKVQYQDLITLYRAVNEAGVTNIAFAATR